MPSITFDFSQIVAVLQRFLADHQLIGALRALELETGCLLPQENDDIAFMRELIYDGRWEDVELLVSPMSSRAGFDANSVLFECRKQKFLELYAGKVVPDAVKAEDEDGADGVSVLALVSALREVEEVAPSKQTFNSLCYILTLSNVNDHPDYAKWTVYTGRHACFTAAKEQLLRLFPTGVYGDAPTRQTAQNGASTRQNPQENSQNNATLEEIFAQAGALQALSRVAADPRLVGQLKSPLHFEPEFSNGISMAPHSTVIPLDSNNRRRASFGDDTTVSVRESASMGLDSRAGLEFAADLPAQLSLWSKPKPVVSPLPYDIPIPPVKFAESKNESSMRASASNLSMTLGRMRRSMGLPVSSLAGVQSPPARIRQSTNLHHDTVSLANLRKTLADIPVGRYPGHEEDEPETKQEQTVLDDRLARSVGALLARQDRIGDIGVNAADTTPVRHQFNAPSRPQSAFGSRSVEDVPAAALTVEEVSAIRSLLRQSIQMESPSKVGSYGHFDGVSESAGTPESAGQRRRSAVKWEVPFKGNPSRPMTADGSMLDTIHPTLMSDAELPPRPTTAHPASRTSSGTSAIPAEPTSQLRRSKWASIGPEAAAPAVALPNTPQQASSMFSPQAERVAALLGSYDHDLQSIPSSSLNMEWLRASKAPLKQISSPSSSGGGDFADREPASRLSAEANSLTTSMAPSPAASNTHERTPLVTEDRVVPDHVPSVPVSGHGADAASFKNTLLPASPPQTGATNQTAERSGFGPRKPAVLPAWLDEALSSSGCDASTYDSGYVTMAAMPSLRVAPKAVHREAQPLRCVAFNPSIPTTGSASNDTVLFAGTNAKALRALRVPGGEGSENAESDTDLDAELSLPKMHVLHEWAGHHLGSVYALSIADFPTSEQLLIATGSNDTNLKVAKWQLIPTGEEDGYAHLGNALPTDVLTMAGGVGTIRDTCWFGKRHAESVTDRSLNTFASQPLLACGGGGHFNVNVFDINAYTSKRPAPYLSLAGHSDTVHSIKPWGQDGKQLLSCSADGTVRLWDIRVRKAAATFALSGAGGNPTTGLYHSGSALPSGLSAGPSGVELHSLAVRGQSETVVGCGNGTVAIIDVTANRLVTAARLHSDEVRSVDVLGPMVLSASFDGTIAISAAALPGVESRGGMSTAELCVLVTRSDHRDKVLCARWHPFANMLATSSADKTVMLWDIYYD